MLTKYGTDNIIIGLLVGVAILTLSYFISKVWATWILDITGALIILFTLWFFRDPSRQVPQQALNDHSIILSPADGKIVEIKKIHESKFMNSDAIQISIFLSPLDVHVNRSPVTGIVKYYQYVPGDYLVAYHPKASELNEHSLIGVQTDYGIVMFKQITGILARRLVCEIKNGDSLTAGTRFGMMKFGSRMDIIVDPKTEILVKIGQRVVGGETLLARLQKK